VHRQQALTFVVVGAGPTGVEFTAELRDLIEEDLPKYYSHLLPVGVESVCLLVSRTRRSTGGGLVCVAHDAGGLWVCMRAGLCHHSDSVGFMSDVYALGMCGVCRRQFVRVKLVEASDRVLMMFDEALQQEAVRQLTSAPRKLVEEGLIQEDMTEVLLKVRRTSTAGSMHAMLGPLSRSMLLIVWSGGGQRGEGPRDPAVGREHPALRPLRLGRRYDHAVLSAEPGRCD
jgi:hypothetical protein